MFAAPITLVVNNIAYRRNRATYDSTLRIGPNHIYGQVDCKYTPEDDGWRQGIDPRNLWFVTGRLLSSKKPLILMCSSPDSVLCKLEGC